MLLFPLQALQVNEELHSLLCFTSSRAGQLQLSAGQGRAGGGEASQLHGTLQRAGRASTLLPPTPKELPEQMAHDLPCYPWIICQSSL